MKNKHKSPIPDRYEEFSTLVKTLDDKLSSYGWQSWGITQDETVKLHHFAMQCDLANKIVLDVDQLKRDAVRYRHDLRYNPLGTSIPSIVNTLLAVLKAPPPQNVDVGAEELLRKIYQKLKLSKVADNVLADLGFTPAEIILDPVTAQPVITKVAQNGDVVQGAVELRYRGSYNVYVARAGKEPVLLGSFTQHEFVDHHPLPAEVQEWEYIAVYTEHDVEIGKASLRVPVMVKKLVLVP